MGGFFIRIFMNELIEGKEYIVFHPRLNRVCLLWINDGSNNLLYDMEGDDDFIYDVQNIVMIGEL